MEIESNTGQARDEATLVSDQHSISRESRERLQAALDEIRETDPSKDQLRVAIESYKKARSNLQDVVEEPGVSDQRIKEIIGRLDQQIDLMDDILTGISEARRKLTILNNNSPVPEPKLKQLVNHLIKASKAAEQLDRTEPKLERYQKELAEHSELFGSLPDEPYSLAADESRNGTDSNGSRSSSTGCADDESSGKGSSHSGKSRETKYDAETGTSEQEASKDELIAELHRLKGTVGDIPKKVHIQKFSQYRLDTFEAEFGSVEESIDAAFSIDEPAEEAPSERAGDEEEHTEPPTDQTDDGEKQGDPTRSELLEEFERVGDQLGKRPTTSEFDEHSKYESDDVYEQFDSWGGIVEVSEIDSAARDDLLDDLYRLKTLLGVPPLSSHIEEHGQYSVYDYRMEFGSVEDALEEAGLDIESHVLEILEGVVEESDEKPKMADFSAASPYQSNTIYKWFSSWDEALEAARENQIEADDLTVKHGKTVQEITQNELSEIYELTRNLRIVTNAIVDTRDVFMADYPDELADPMVDWAEIVDDFWRGNSTDQPGYGAQQNERNPFSMAEYRQAFGNGDRVTEFECTSARRLTSTVAALLQPHLDADTETFYVPVDPDTSAPLPVIVESRDALRRASKILHRLPTHPEAAAVPTERETGSVDGKGDTDTGAEKILDVNGVTKDIAQALHTAGYRTRGDLKDATMEELTTVDEISEQLAMRIKLDVGE